MKTAFCASVALVVFYRVPLYGEFGRHAYIVLLGWNVIQALLATVLVVEITRTHFNDGDESFRASLQHSYRATSTIFASMAIGSIPIVCILELNSDRFLAVPYGLLLLFQSVFTAWCIAVFCHSLLPELQFSRLLSYLLIFIAFFGLVTVVLIVQEFVWATVFFDPPRPGFVSPFYLYVSRFHGMNHIRPLNNVYPEALTLNAVWGVALLAVSYAITSRRFRNPQS